MRKLALSILVTLACLIPPAFAQTSPTVRVNSIAELQTLAIPTVTTKLTALVTGRYGVGDNVGTSLWWYDPSDSTTPGDGLTVTPGSTGKRWKRMFGVASGTTVDTPFFPSNSALLCDGDSLLAGVPKIFYTLTNSFPSWQRFGMYSNFAVAGSSMVDVNARWTTNTAPAIAAAQAAGLTNIYLLFDIGANELGTASATFTANWANYITRAKSSNVTVIAFTIMPQNIGVSNSIQNWYLDNSYMRMSPLPDYLVDWARLIPNPSDTTWSVDGTHLTTAGYLRVAQHIDSLLRNPIQDRISSVSQTDFNTNFVIALPDGHLAAVFGHGSNYIGDETRIQGNLSLWTDSTANSRGTYFQSTATDGYIVYSPALATMEIESGRSPGFGGIIDFNIDTSKFARLNSTGLGIGTTTSTNILELKSATPLLSINGTAVGVPFGLELKSNDTLESYVREQPNISTLAINSGRGAGWGGIISWLIDTTQKVRLDGTGLGINTNASTAFEVLGDATIDGDIYSKTGVLSNQHGIYFSSSTNDASILSQPNLGSLTINSGRSPSYGGYQQWAVDTTNKMRLNGYGLAINTITSTNVLEVNDPTPLVVIDGTTTSVPFGVEFKTAGTLESYIKEQPNVATMTINSGRSVGYGAALILSADTAEVARYMAGGFGVGVLNTNNISALFQVDSTTKGLLPPRMTKAQRDAIGTPADGLMIYQTDGTVGLHIRQAGAWVSVNTTADP